MMTNKRIFFLLYGLLFYFRMFGMELDLPCYIAKLSDDLKQNLAQDYLDVCSIGRLGQTCKWLKDMSYQAFLATKKNYPASNRALDCLRKKHEYLIQNKIQLYENDLPEYNNALHKNKELFDLLWRCHAEKRKIVIRCRLNIKDLSCNVDDRIAPEVIGVLLGCNEAGSFFRVPDPLLSACDLELPNTVAMLLDKNPDVMIHRAQEVLQHACHKAGTFGSEIVKVLEIAEIAVARGANVNATNEHGQAILHCLSDSLEVAQMLLNKGANVNLIDKKGKTALHYLADRHRYHLDDYDNIREKLLIEIVKILLEHKADPNIFDSCFEMTPLCYACAQGSTEMVRILLENKANPNVVYWSSGMQMPLLCYVCIGHSTEIAKLLVEWGADVNATKQHFYFRLFEEKPSREIMEILSNNNVDIKALPRLAIESLVNLLEVFPRSKGEEILAGEKKITWLCNQDGSMSVKKVGIATISVALVCFIATKLYGTYGLSSKTS